MESFYAVQKKVKSTTELSAIYENDSALFKTICSVSTLNLIAYTTTTEISDLSETSLGFHVYVADINCPWNIHKVTSNKFPISVLEWDILGKFLLIGDISGHVQLWIQKDFLISEWTQLYSINFPGEKILKAVFFHNGKKMILNTEKKEQISYMDKFQRVKLAPSVRQFGGVPSDGCLVISFTGMVGAFLIPSEPPSNLSNLQGASNQGPFNLTPVTDSLGLTRNFCTAVDVCYIKNGQFLIAVSNGAIKVQCFRVKLSKVNDKITIASNFFPSFFLASEDIEGLNDVKIENLKWVSPEDSDSIIIAANHSGGCLVQIWGLVEKFIPIHKLFQTSKSEVFKTDGWTKQAQYTSKNKLVDICTSKLTFGTTPYVAVAMDNMTIHILNSENLREVAEETVCFYSNENSAGDHRTKISKYGPQIAAIDITWMGQMLIQIDASGQIFVYRLQFSQIDSDGNPYTELNFLLLLEYCLVTGMDYIDVLLNLKVQFVDSIIEKLSENFNRQTSIVQQYYYVNFLTLKTNLYRLTVSGQSKAHDLTSLLMLHSILIAFKSLLRPSDLTCHDKGPAENLAMVLSESVPDVDKVLLNLDGKDFTVEPSTLQSLQQLIQWVADLALNILAKLPENRCLVGAAKNTGYEISKDIVALNSIRELLVMIRIWGLLKPQCLPVFSSSADNLDILSTLFRALTRLALNPNEPDEVLLDEACMLPSQVLIPQLQSVSSRTSVASPLLTYLTPPLKFHFGIEPESLKFCPDLPIIEGGLSNDNMVDSIRHIQLGKQPHSLKKCSRCGACSSIASIARTAAMRAWEQRWASRCICCGSWSLQTLAGV